MPANIDFDAHNAEVREVWDAYHKKDPIRVPCSISMNVRMILLDPQLNPEGVRFKEYFQGPEVMLSQQLKFQEWARTEIFYDQEMGLPEAWPIYIDYQNVYEAAWFGSEVHYWENNCPSTKEWLTDDNKWEIIDRGVPETSGDGATGGWIQRSWDYHERWCALRNEGFTYRGRPIAPEAMGDGTDGPFTVAVNLRGEAVCIDMLTDPDYYHALLSLITEATILRLQERRKRLGEPLQAKDWGFADDSICLLSVDQYREFVQPYHERLIGALAEGEKPPVGIHLCGDVQRFFPHLVDAININRFDTGFPIDLARAREEVGPGVELWGGPKVDLLRGGPVEAIEAETKRILESGVTQGGRFIIRDANNLSPCTPPAHVKAFYEAVRRYGRYR